MILNADARALPLADGVVQTVVTSPPYWGLRDYGTRGGIGLEDSHEEWVEAMVRVFREVRRVLRPDGTAWLNVGDAYANDGKWGGSSGGKNEASGAERRKVYTGLKPKDLIGLPWRLAFALQADGWHLRADVIWAKPNPMPESVRDRPTRSHEHLFLLTPSPRYYYDPEAVREPVVKLGTPGHLRAGNGDGRHENYADSAGRSHDPQRGRNIRDVWSVPTQPFPDAHFATFPERLVAPCVLAGTSERGACPRCGAPWERVEERRTRSGDWRAGRRDRDDQEGASRSDVRGGQSEYADYLPPVTIGWRPTCDHDLDPRPCLVLDPFAGAGTTGVVARRLGRRFVGVELSEDYCRMARRRVRDEGRLRGPASLRPSDEFEEVPLL